MHTVSFSFAQNVPHYVPARTCFCAKTMYLGPLPPVERTPCSFACPQVPDLFHWTDAQGHAASSTDACFGDPSLWPPKARLQGPRSPLDVSSDVALSGPSPLAPESRDSNRGPGVCVGGGGGARSTLQKCSLGRKELSSEMIGPISQGIDLILCFLLSEMRGVINKGAHIRESREGDTAVSFSKKGAGGLGDIVICLQDCKIGRGLRTPLFWKRGDLGRS